MKANVLVLAIALILIASRPMAQFVGYEKGIVWGNYLSGTDCGIAKAGVRVLVTEGDWQKYWSELNGGKAPASSAPRDIDWNKEQLIAINLGQRPTMGYQVYVESIRRNNPSEYVVQYVETTPMAGQIVPQAVSSPFAIIKMERALGNPTFAQRTAVQRFYGSSWGNKGGCGCKCGCASCKCH